MPNYLKMPKQQQVLALLELGWSYRRIEAETGVRRETVGRYDRARQAKAAKTFPGSEVAGSPRRRGDRPPSPTANAAKTFAGSDPNAAKMFAGSAPKRSRFAAAAYRDAITEKLDAGLSLQRIWQDLVEEFGYGASYESVKRYVRTLAPRRRAVGVFHCAPGAEGASGLLSRRADARRGDRAVASPVGVSHDAGPLASRLRGGGVGSAARDLPPPARAGVPRSGRRRRS